MEFEYAYRRSSAVDSSATGTAMSFSPDTKREPTFFRGKLKKQLAFREAISALHSVVTSDLRWKPKDRTAYMEWLASQEELDWMQIAGQRETTKARIDQLSTELAELRTKSSERMRPFYRARQAYFDYLYKKDYDAWFVLDPVITVHPDQVFFECFSQDESSYGRLSASYEVFGDIGDFSCGTTNIDYSQALYDEFQKIRTYKDTLFEIDPTGFQVETEKEEVFKEVKIDLPDSWVRGFLQVSSAMTLPAKVVELHPMDIYNLCLYLRRHKEVFGPRSLRIQLRAGEPVTVVVDPWGTEIRCPRSRYLGDTNEEIRLWGRRRLHILERLIPLANSFKLYILGQGMPYFFVADLGDMSFTLGLSGWTKNDWSQSGNFDLMAPRADVDDLTKRRVFDALKSEWRASSEALASKLSLDEGVVLGALGAYTQAGRVIFDLVDGVYRCRELAREALPMDKLRFDNPREREASELLANKQARTTVETGADNRVRIKGVVGEGSKAYGPILVLDLRTERLVEATCTCNFYQQNALRYGPCAHILAARIAFERSGQRPTVTVGAGPDGPVIGDGPYRTAQPPTQPSEPEPEPPAGDDESG
ncbi:MAG: SWIM zinc finger domain-containing protein, partial [Deltaproteobacteria bacterium]|nr:SWIM zinc finger domain-containing protein [Deltaproteobacteria bacterium]